jgi:hypothetical protein
MIFGKGGREMPLSWNNLGYHSKRTFSTKWQKTDLTRYWISVFDILALLPYVKLVKLCQILIVNPFLEPIRIDNKIGLKVCGLKPKPSGF